MHGSPFSSAGISFTSSPFSRDDSFHGYRARDTNGRPQFRRSADGKNIDRAFKRTCRYTARARSRVFVCSRAVARSPYPPVGEQLEYRSIERTENQSGVVITSYTRRRDIYRLAEFISRRTCGARERERRVATRFAHPPRAIAWIYASGYSSPGQ